jgi:hypothetical protein
VREPLVIAMRRVDLEVLVDLEVAVRHYFGAHVVQFTVSGNPPLPTARLQGRYDGGELAFELLLPADPATWTLNGRVRNQELVRSG